MKRSFHAKVKLESLICTNNLMVTGSPVQKTQITACCCYCMLGPISLVGRYRSLSVDSKIGLLGGSWIWGPSVPTIFASKTIPLPNNNATKMKVLFKSICMFQPLRKHQSIPYVIYFQYVKVCDLSISIFMEIIV